MGIAWSEMNDASNGGTEMLGRELERRLSPDLLDEFQIFPSRITQELDPNKIRILWCHDLPEDDMYSHLRDGGWKKFHKIVFVSNLQMQSFIQRFEIPWSRCQVMLNAIEPLPFEPKSEGPIRLIYTSTPHRGLNVLLAAFYSLSERHEDIVLDVYSSFGLYGWDERDEPYKALFQQAIDHPRIDYHGAVPNSEVREALSRAHVFAYPSIWPETSCLCLMEAMSSDLVCVHSNYGALPETGANWTIMYPYNESLEAHAGIFMNALEIGIDQVRRGRKVKPSSQKMYADLFYSWDLRAKQWEALLNSLLNLPREIESGGADFVYKIGS